jgi:phosphatidylinositol 3-kinase
MESFSFASSADLQIPVRVKINELEGFEQAIPLSKLMENAELRHVGSNTNPHSELYVTARLWADSKPLTIEERTPYKAFKNKRIWNEWLIFSINYSSIPVNTQLAITLWDLSPTGGDGARGHYIPFGGTTIPLFDEKFTLQTGRQTCYIHRRKAADGFSSSTTPHILPVKKRGTKNGLVHDQADDEATELSLIMNLMKKQEVGEIPEDKWLDQLVFRKVEKMQTNVLKKRLHAQRSMSNGYANGTVANGDASNNEGDSGIHHLYIEFPRFDHPIVFTDKEYPAPPISNLKSSMSQDVRLKPPPEVSLGPGIESEGHPGEDPALGPLIRIYDPELGFRSNPVEDKHRALMRGHRSALVDRDLKPNARNRDDLNRIMNYGANRQLTDQEKDMIWRFRHFLTRDKRALTKFVKSVNWADQKEAREASQMLPKWVPIDVDDALELLGPNFDHPAVRAYAVDRLRRSSDDELLMYLLQLVQALRYERRPSDDGRDEEAVADSSLATFLIGRAARNPRLGSYLHWYLMVEFEDRSPQQDAQRELFGQVEFDFMNELVKTTEGEQNRKILLKQGEMIRVLSKIARELRDSRQPREKKITRLKQFLADPKNELITMDPTPLFLDPSVSIVGCYPEEANVFKSSLSPLKIVWKTSAGSKYQMIFKVGDDLRQDQLVIQTIMLMDRLLKNENLDLKLMPYHILATSPVAGAVQFIPSTPLSDVDKTDRSILNFLRRHNPDPNAPLGVRKETMDTYIKSCAGYCVITYILGIGDRHLDNLLLTPNGNFFHADFGYILGRDPKPFAPLMKLSTQMVDGMGGPDHENFRQFRQHCATAYLALRKSANLILNLFALMTESNVQDIRNEPDKAVWKVEERLQLEKEDMEATAHFEWLIDTVRVAWAPKVIDTFHTFTQQLRG